MVSPCALEPVQRAANRDASTTPVRTLGYQSFRIMKTLRNRKSNRAYPIAALLFAGSIFSPYATANANAQACTITTAPGTSSSFARQQFAQSCPNRIRRDCDPFQGGWQCSTENLPLRGGTNTPVSTPSTPSTPSSGNAVLSVQAENSVRTTGSGWSTERSLRGFSGSGYIVWRGSDDFRVSDQAPPAGIKAYDFTVTTPGTYEFTARVQARVGNGSAANDKDNDAWVKFTSGSATAGVRGDSSKWTKFFVSGSDESWKNYSNGEQYSPTFFTEIRRNLPAGKHRVLIGGRSARFAIDSVGLQLIRASGPSTPVISNPQAPAPSNPTTPVNPSTPVAPGSCSARGNSLQQAKNNYAASCPRIPRKDCDPIGGGNWLCSSGSIGSGAQPVVDNPAPTQPTQPSQPTEPASPVASGSCSARGSSLQQAKNNYADSCPRIPRKDCDPVGGGNWLCSSVNIGSGSQSVVVTPATPAPTISPPPTQTGTIGRFSRGDLLVLHYDNCPDRDDGHAIASAKAVLDKVGISNTLVVNGTCGASIRSSYQPSSVNVLLAVFGNNWLDGFNDETRAVNTSADRWATTLANGDDVWVAEGGPSDFTAKVLRRIGSEYPSVNRKRIRVVQHSSGRGFNERFTSAPSIALVKQVADYITIPDGNNTNNGSADFNQKSSSFVAIARQSRFAREWNAAFDYLNPNSKLDFSDTVEIMYIINDTRTLTVNDFANRYLR